MIHNQTALLHYNKNKTETHGTLIYNWFEERELKDATGVPRTQKQHHIPKKREDLFKKPPHEVPAIQQPKIVDDHQERVLGERKVDFPKTENYGYGKGVNKADERRQTGQKALMRDQYFLNTIEQELKEQQFQQEHEANTRYFETTTQAEFYKKDLDGNTIGKRVMKTQDGKPLKDSDKDNDLLVDNGFLGRPQFLTDEQLKQMLPQGESYLKQQPITFWQEKQNDGCFYMSKQNNNNTKITFNKNDNFCKTYSHFTHVKK